VNPILKFAVPAHESGVCNSQADWPAPLAQRAVQAKVAGEIGYFGHVPRRAASGIGKQIVAARNICPVSKQKANHRGSYRLTVGRISLMES
jgi:hypothetical protein